MKIRFPRAGSFIVTSLALSLAGCGVGYELIPARIDITGVTDQSYPAVVATVRDILEKEGFEYVGGHERITALMRQGHSVNVPTNNPADLLEHEQAFDDWHQHMRVDLTNCVAAAPSWVKKNPLRPDNHFVELALSDERPGGFGEHGLAVYNHLLAALTRQYGAPSVRIIEPPPPTDEAEYRRVTNINRVTKVFWWCIAFALFLAVIGSAMYAWLRRLDISVPAKRITFVVVVTLLATPLPLRLDFFTLLLPSLMFPIFVSVDYVEFVAFADASFPAAAILCAIISMLLFRKDTASIDLP